MITKKKDIKIMKIKGFYNLLPNFFKKNDIISLFMYIAVFLQYFFTLDIECSICLLQLKSKKYPLFCGWFLYKNIDVLMGPTMFL